MTCSIERLRRDRPLAAGIFFLVLAIYILTYNGAFKSNDERALFSGTDSFVKRGVFTVDQIYWDYTHVGMLTTSGEMVPNYEPAPMILAIPFYLWGRALGAAVQGTMFLGLVVTAGLAATIYLCLIELGYGRRTGTLAALILAVGTHIWPYSRTLFREPLTALAYAVAFFGLLRYRAAGPRRLGWLILAGSALGLALLNKQTSVAVFPALFILAVAGEWRRSGGWRARVAPALAGLLPVAFFMLLYWLYKDVTLRGVTTWARDIVVYTTNPQLSSSEAQRLLRAFLGLTISPYKGMLWFSPVLFLGLAGTWPFLRRHPWEGAACWTAIVIHLAGYSRYLYWSGGVTWGSRYMLVLIPFGIMLAAPVLAWLLNEPAPPVLWRWRRGAAGSRGWQAFGRPEPVVVANAADPADWRTPGDGTRWQEAGRRGVAAALCVFVILLSFGIQILGVSLDWRTYEVNGFLLPQAKIWGGIGETIDTLYLHPEFSPVLGHLKLLLGGKQPLDFAWIQLRPQLGSALLPGGLALSLAAVGAAAAALAWLWCHPENRRGMRNLVAGEAVAAVVCCSALLLIYRQGDARFDPYGGDRYLRPMDAALKTALANGQASCCRTNLVGAPSCTGVLVVPDDTLTDYFLNYLTAPLPWYDIQPQPADTRVLDQLMTRYPNIWVARDRNAADDDQNGRRGTERYLVDHAYKVDEQSFGNWSRLIHFSAAGGVTQTVALKQTLGEMALDQVALRVASDGPAQACTNQAKGQANAAAGDTAPSGTGVVRAQRGDTLQIGLDWRAQAKPAANYTVFVQLLDTEGQVKAQRDRWPGDGLYPTTGLAAGQTLVDNLALRLDLPPGRYRLIAGMYRNDVAGLPRLTGPAGDHLTIAEVNIE
ncbi:MAG TPA: glycosyltransferase family 39 protein [Anaerolineae bacterium]